MAALEQIIASTHRAARKRAVDNFFKGIPLFQRMRLNDQVRTLTPENGRKIVLPIVKNDSNGGYYIKGETFAAADTEEFTAAEYEWRACRKTPYIDGLDKWMNQGAAQIIPLWDGKVDVAVRGIRNEVSAAMYDVASTADTSRSIVPIEQFLDDDDTYTVGGLKASDGIARWSGATDVSVGGALTLGKVEEGVLNASEGDITPTDLVTTKTGYGIFYNLVVTQQRYIGKDNRVGFKNFYFDNAAVHFDSNVLASGGEFTGNRIYVLNLNHLYLVIGEGADMVIEDKTPPNADGYAAQIKLYHALVCDARWAQGCVHNFT